MTRVLAPLRRLFERDTGGEWIFPLVILSALYFFDEFDTSAFGTLAPDIQRTFHLSDRNFIGLIILNVSITVMLAIPVGYLADRVSRTRLVVISGLLAGAFSFGTGLVGSVVLLAVVRFGNGVGLVANLPVHNSLLSDYYRPEHRPSAFANHTNAMYLGAIMGPALAGVLGHFFGWRSAFFVLFVPIVITTFVATRLPEPHRGATDDPEAAALAAWEPPPKFVPAVKMLWGVPTLRYQLFGAVLLGAGLLPLAAYLPLFYDRAFHLGPFVRGVLQAWGNLFIFAGVQRGGTLTPRWFAKGMETPLRRAGLAMAGVGVGLAAFAMSPVLPVAVAVSAVTSFVTGLIFAPFFAVQALVSPPRARTLSFSLGAMFLVAGVALFFGTGLARVSDAFGIRWGLVVLSPFWVAAGGVLAFTGRYVGEDAIKAVNSLAEVAERRRRAMEEASGAAPPEIP